MISDFDVGFTASTLNQRLVTVDHEPTPKFVLGTGRRLDAKIGSSHSMSEIEISLGGVLAHPVGHNGQPAGKPIAGSHALCPTDAVLD